jgi:SAM-dependent methyltransferase
MSAPYTGIDNLEIMAGAVKYLRFLNDRIAAVAGPTTSGPRLLDFGAGSGTHAIDLHHRGYAVDCLEIDPTLQDHLRDAGLTVFADVAELVPESYDVAYTMNVLEHIDDDLAAVRSLARALRPGGKLVVYVPALQILYSSMDTKVGHLRRYRLGQLVDTVRRAGFQVDRCRYVDSLGFAATLAYKVVGSRQGDISTGSVSFYDRYGFPVSRGLDRVLDRVVGKNLLLVATRPATLSPERP